MLFCALTNVAVDNVLEALLDAAVEDGEDAEGGEGGEGGGADEAEGGGGGGAGGGFESVAGILRVGSLQRISRRVLPHSTHGKIDAADEG